MVDRGAARVRRAGRLHLPDGAEIIWSIAEGARGRRWRAASTVDGMVTHALLLEVGSDLRPGRLELTSGAGMLTLHPGHDGRVVEGNVVGRDGVRPLSYGWSPEHEFEVVGRPVATLVMLRRLAGIIAVGEGETVPVISIDTSLVVRPGSRLVRRLAEDRWEVADLGARRAGTFEIDARGLPIPDADAAEWPLED